MEEQERLLFRTIHDVVLTLERERSGREANSSGGILDSQSVKAPHGTAGGYDAGKKVLGRKRHIAVDTDGCFLMANLTSADVSDSAGVPTILAGIRKRWPWLKHLFAEGAYDRGRLMSKAAFREFVVEIVRRMDPGSGFKVLPRKCVVERTFGWMVRWRRLVRNYEARLDVPEAFIHVARASPVGTQDQPLSLHDTVGVRQMAELVPMAALPRLKLVWADGAHTGPFAKWLGKERGWRMEIPFHRQRQAWRYGLEERPAGFTSFRAASAVC